MNECSCNQPNKASMDGCPRNQSSSRTVTLNGATRILEKLRTYFTEGEFPEERILEIYPGISAIAVGSENGRSGGMIVPILGVGFWLNWNFDNGFKFTSQENLNISLNLFLSLTNPNDPIKLWKIKFNCNDGECSSSIVEENVKEDIICENNEISLFSNRPNFAQENSKCSCWDRCTEDGFCWVVCAFGCVLRRG